MHEYAITKNIIDISVAEAEKAGASKITEIRLVIGELSSIIDDSVQMYYNIISSGTIAENAKLVFKRIPISFRCKSCGMVFTSQDSKFECPVCGGMSSLLGEAREFYIESIEVE
jgi:hydrogenase nickel incorporation protein HypA/HybF